MKIELKCGCLLLLALLIPVTVIPLYIYTSTNTPTRGSRLHGRGITSSNDGNCRELELQLEYLQTLMKAEEQQHAGAMERLRAQGIETKRKLDIQRELVTELERRNQQLIDKLQHLESGGPRHREDDYRLAPDISPYKVRTLNIQQRSEFEVIPYTSFSKDKLYSLEMGMVNKPEAKAIGDREKEMDEVMEKALEVLNDDDEKQQYTFHDLLEGYMRIERTVGTEYDMYFRVKDKKHVFQQEGREEVKDILEKVAAKHHYSHYKFIAKDEEFSRGVGLLAGAQVWDQGNVLLFFCDVDIVFKPDFLDRCRLNAAPSSRLFYPIVFSLYNPSVVYSDQPSVPGWKDQLVMNKQSGFWRTFGFGMTCMYRSDFLSMRGFDTKIQGWGFEDVKLYRKFIRSSLEVVRAPDQGIFHLWHEKTCDPLLPPAQYRMCLGSKAMSEASHENLGRLAFKELILENEKLHNQFDNI
ncbi:Chondroitin sulfate N-acetylgalactosaminyltransferase 2 [Geodia barretti]|uniref:Hexosyltransferase n=1 Tax=Geodia barretti TaxID=519541 RepID=A0AA35RYA0_GEOBA|nr:Chondroitin sulfate N-acetylgalactosaminyltransferase 2 [Geodia barretti]